MNVDIQTDSVFIERTFKATSEKVFRCFTDAEIAKKWMAPSEMSCVELEMDVTVGGSFRLTMENRSGEQFTSVGKYLEVDPYSRLVYDWQWQIEDSSLTKVVIDLKDTTEGCLMSFTHSGFKTQEVVNSHAEGWVGCIAKLMMQLG